ncbi:hypothetical protein N9N28_18240 [Rubripirellula amarantea]|nr:hypothetical protein [Rubripirellula amarantea]
MVTISVNVICCDDSADKYSQLAVVDMDPAHIDTLVVDTMEQRIEANAERGLHNAAHHDEHGPVTYFQEVHAGGFTVRFGKPDQLQEKFFGPGTYVAFMDDEGTGHGSLVGPEGVRRTLKVLKGHLDLKPA